MDQQVYDGLHDSLRRGRHPFASAELRGGYAHPGVKGEISFYDTPAGVLVSARLQGLPGRGGTTHASTVYGFCLGERESDTCSVGCGRNCRFCRIMPSLYEKDGNAWCSFLTRKLSVSDLEGRRITLRERTVEYPGFPVASGALRTPHMS